MTDFNKENFPGNEIVKEPEETKKVVKVTKGAIRQRKEPFLYKIFGGETAKNIFSYILWDVIVPAAKSTVTDVVSNSIEMIFYGDEGRKSNRVRRDKSRSYVSYSSIYDNRKSGSGYQNSSARRERNRNRHRFDDVIIETRVDAEEVLSTLVELIDQYDLCTVKDFYEAVGISAEYTDNKWGWESLGNASIRPVRGGYILDLPTPQPYD